MHHHDPHYRRMFGHPAIMRALLEGFMPTPLLAMLDLDSLQIVPTEHLADPLRPRQPLPLILPIVLYSGMRRWRHATRMQALQGPVPDFLRPYQLNHGYLLLDMGKLVHQGGLPEDNLASLIFQLEHNERVEQAGTLLQAIVRQVASSTDGQELTRILGAWARHILLPRALPEHITLPDTEELSELTAMTIAYSRDWTLRPREEGRQEGQVELLSHQLVRKFGALPPQYQARLSQASLKQLKRWSLNVLDAQTLEQVFN